MRYVAVMHFYIKYILLIITVSFIGITTYAQAVAKVDNAKTQIGLSLGPSVTNMIDKYAYQYERKHVLTSHKISYSAVFHIQHRFNKTWAFRTELFYTKKRIRTDGLDNSGYYFYDMMFVDACKIELPVLFKVSVKRFFIETGPYLGFSIGERYTVLYFTSDKKKVADRSRNFSWSDDGFLQGMYWGACFGVGYNVLNTEKYSLSLSLRDDLEFTTDRPINDTRLNTVNLLLGAAVKL